MKAIGERVAIKCIPEGKTFGDIVVVQKKDKKPTSGVVISVGGKVECVSVGDKVLFPAYAGNDFVIAGEKHKIVYSDEILAIEEN